MLASIEALEDVVDVFRGYAVAVIGDGDAEHHGSALPRDLDDSSSARVVEGILHDVFDCLSRPVRITEELLLAIALYPDFFVLVLGPCRKLAD